MEVVRLGKGKIRERGKNNQIENNQPSHIGHGKKTTKGELFLINPIISRGPMTNKSNYLLILLTIIIISFPSLGYPEEKNEILLKPVCNMYYGDVINYLQTQKNRITLGLTIVIKIKDQTKDEIEKYKDIEEEWFYTCLSLWKDIGNKVKVVDRRHLSKVLEEQKLSSSGITDSETVKLGKILNLDIMLLEHIYDDLTTQKLLKIDTG